MTSVSPIVSLMAGSVDVSVTDCLFLWWLVLLTSVSPTVSLVLTSVSPIVSLVAGSVDFSVTVSLLAGSVDFGVTDCFSCGWFC